MAADKGLRKLAAILAADVAGYSRLMADDEDATVGTLTEFREVYSEHVDAHHGRIVDTAGDSVLATFDSVVEAVEAAVAIQSVLNKRNEQLTEHRQMHFRIGVNLGDIIVRDDGTIYGDAVNIAARLEPMADPGGILISQTVRDGVVGRIDLDLFDNGERTFKNIAQPIRVWSWPRQLSAALVDSKPHVFVAEFDGRSETESNLAINLREELGAHLARLTGLEIVAEQRNAHYIVGGSVRLLTGRARVFARLTAADTTQQIWSDRFSLTTDDPFEVLDQCAPSISMTVRRRIAADDAVRAADKNLDDLSLEKLMAVAGCSFFKPTREGWAGGGRLAGKALERAPDNYMALAMAAAGLGADESLYGFRRQSKETVDLAFVQIEKALRENSRSDMLYVTQSLLLLYGRKRHREAIAAARRSLDLNPDFNMGYWMLGSGQVFSGDYTKGLESAEHAVAIDIRDPYVHLYSRIAGYGHLGAANLGEAVDWFQKADHLSPGLFPNLCGLAVSQWIDEDEEGARNAVQRLVDAEPEFRLSTFEPLPFKDPDMWRRFRDALQCAGAPE
jgi:adenylate cyclase